MPKLTAELIHTFIQRVDVYEKPTKYSRTEGNPVMIYYKYQMTTSEQWQILTGEGLPKTDTTKAEIDTNPPTLMEVSSRCFFKRRESAHRHFYIHNL